MKGPEVLSYLARQDKWFLGGGKAVVWAPEFPQWLEKPGFWDPACYLDYRVEPIFTLALVDSLGREVELLAGERTWQPDKLTQNFKDKTGSLNVTEKRSLLSGDVLVSEFEFNNLLPHEKTLDLIIWTAQEREGGTRQGPSLSEIEQVKIDRQAGSIIFQRQVRENTAKPLSPGGEEGVLMRFAVALGASLAPISYGLKTSDRQPNQPHWRFSPFYEKLAENKGISLGKSGPENFQPGFEGLLYLGLHHKLTLPPGEKVRFRTFAAIAGSEEDALHNYISARGQELNQATGTGDHGTPQAGGRGLKTPSASDQWGEYFESIPSFSCSDPFIQKYYWYRWFGLRLNTINIQDDRLGLPYPCIFEGINLGWFRQHITYSAQCHMFETRWMHDPALAQGSLLNFIENQAPNGSFPGAIKNIYRGDRTLNIGVAFYHANWGQALRAVHAVHPDRSFLEKIYAPLARYMAYFDRERDADQTGLYDVLNHWETGQEFMSRYMAVDQNADAGGPLRLKGLDATSYIYQLEEALAWMSKELGKDGETGRWQAMALRTRQAVLSQMWDPGQKFFFDFDPATSSRIMAKTPLGFYPFMAGIAGKEHLEAFNHLFNEAEFWTPYPVPTTSLDDPTFSPDGEWKGQRLVCPWNGRTWLMTNSHVAEALAMAAQQLDPGLKPRAVEFLGRFIKMLFLDGDLERPSSYEYYNPITGQAPFFRGTEDYMHSWIVDLIIKYVAGVQPAENGILNLRPLPFGLDHFTLDRLKIAGHFLKITWRKDEKTARAQKLAGDPAPVGYSVYIDNRLERQFPGLVESQIKL